MAKSKPPDWNNWNARMRALWDRHAKESAELRREMIERALEESHHEITVTAKTLGIGRGKLYSEMKSLGIKPEPRGRGRSSPSAQKKRWGRYWG